jgi:hypothetical protein
MKNSIKNLIAALIFFGLFLATIEYLSAGETRDDGLILARSCFGETTPWNETECTAMLFVYLKRTPNDSDVTTTAKKYSSALKRGQHNKNRHWLFELNRELDKPKSWPDKAKWSVYKLQWARLLKLSDDFLSGKLTDPCPECDHFGGAMDKADKSLILVKTDFECKNKFYRIKGKQ